MLMNVFLYYKALQVDLLAGPDHLAGVSLAGIFCQAALSPKTRNSNSINHLNSVPNCREFIPKGAQLYWGQRKCVRKAWFLKVQG
jgi:hypothetical protein